MTRRTVLLTSAIAPAHAASLAELHRVVVMPPSHADFMATAGGCDAIVVRDPLPVALFERPQRLRVVVRHGAGLDMIPIEAATEARVAVANVPGVNARSVAEFALGQMIGLARLTFRQDRLLREAGWGEARAAANRGGELSGRTVAVLGYGAVGQALGRICELGFGMDVLPMRRQDVAAPGAILARADFLAIACPLTDETRGLVDRRWLQALKPGAFLVNVARGAVIDEPALLQALGDGRLAGAALDVFAEQPLPRTSPLLKFENVILSPHAAGISKESMDRMSEGAVQQVVQALAGELPTHLVNRAAAKLIRQRWASLDLHQEGSS